MRLPLLWHALRIRPQVWLHAGPTMSAQSNWSGGGSKRRIFHDCHPVRRRKSFFLILPQQQQQCPRTELTVTLNHDGMAAWSLGCALCYWLLHYITSNLEYFLWPSLSLIDWREEGSGISHHLENWSCAAPPTGQRKTSKVSLFLHSCCSRTKPCSKVVRATDNWQEQQSLLAAVQWQPWRRL